VHEPGSVLGAQGWRRRQFRRDYQTHVAHARTARLFNEHWGEQASLSPGNTLEIGMVFYGLNSEQAQTTWKPFLEWIAQRPNDYTFAGLPTIGAVPARNWWNAEFIEAHYPSAIATNSGAGARPGEFWWAGDGDQVGQFLWGYESLWLPSSLLEAAQRARLVDALSRATRHFGFSLHCNKGLAGAPPEAIAAARDTATNPEVLAAFALAISADSESPAYPGIAGHEPDDAHGRTNAARIHASVDELRAVAPGNGSYVSESNYFEKNWQQSYWGTNHSRLAAVKAKYDPQGLFFVHNGVGSERWSADGFTRLG
jgi:hypothetical protein